MSRRDPDAAVRDYYRDPGVLAAFAGIVADGMTRFEAALVRRAFVPGQRILDVGCGAGREGVGMARQGLRVIGIDLVPEMSIAAARHAAAGGIDLPTLCASGTQLPFRASVFDGVAMLGQVLTFIPTRELRIAALRAARRVLRPGGVLVMTTHNRLCHPKFRLFFLWVNGWRRLCRRFGRDGGLGDFDRWSARDFGVRSLSGQRLFFHMYDLEEAVADLQAAELEVLDARARGEFEAEAVDPALRRRDYLLGFVARRPLEPEP